VIRRETAWRLFAAEYNDSTLEEVGTEERSPTYLITPLGAKVNRLFVVGVITENENVGSEEEPVWRARLSDPTGVFYMSAGQYQPEAAQVLANIKPPAFVTVIGKVRTYRPEDDVMYVSIRPESVIETDENVRDQWVLDAAKALKTRVDFASEVVQMAEPSEGELRDLGCPDYLAEGLVKAAQHYPQINIDRYKSILVDSLQYLLPESGERPTYTPAAEMEPEPPSKPKAKTKGTAKEPAHSDNADNETPDADSEESIDSSSRQGGDLVDDGDADLELEDEVMSFIKELDADSGGKGVVWDEIVEKAAGLKLDEEKLEEVINSLVAKGSLYVPSFGKYKIV
jgi:RPA family protein